MVLNPYVLMLKLHFWVIAKMFELEGFNFDENWKNEISNNMS